GQNPHPSAVLTQDPRLLRGLLEPAIAEPAVEIMSSRGNRERRAVGSNLAFTAEWVFLVLRPVTVASDIEVEDAIAIVVEEGRRSAPGGPDKPRVLAGVTERAITIIQVEHVCPEVGQEEVVEAIVIDVAHGQPMREAPVADP